MGAFIVSFHAKTEDPSPVHAVLAEHAERAWIGQPANGWVPFYEERADTQDGERIEELCERTSAAVGGPVIAFLVHDSDLLCYVLFERGEKRDEYNSFPGYFGDPSDLAEPGESSADVLARLRGDVDALLPLCPSGTNRKSLEKLLRVRPGQHVFAEEHLQKLAQALGIDPERAATTYRDVGLEIPPEDLALEFVGTGSPPEPGEDSWHRSAGPSGVAPTLSLFDAEGHRPASERDAVDEEVDDDDAKVSLPDPSQVYAQARAHLENLSRQVTDPRQKLSFAVMLGNAAGVREAIAAGADPNALSGGPLLAAVASRSEEIVRLLLELGAEPAAAPMTLATAAGTGHEAIVRLLLDHGADPRSPNPVGWPPLHAAVQARSPAIIRLLLDAGADPTARGPAGGTPIEMAETMLHQFETGVSYGPAVARDDALQALRSVRELLRAADPPKR